MAYTEAQRRWNAANPDARDRKGYHRKRREEALQLVREAKKKPCADCGREYPHYVMDLDHVRGEKLFNLSAAIKGNRSRAAILAEIAKCDVVCANCHRERTHQAEQCYAGPSAHLRPSGPPPALTPS